MFGNLPVHEEMKKAVKDAVDSGSCNGYGPAQGTMLRCTFHVRGHSSDFLLQN